jgi:drug/metabolite transporter (DMT)-like permease
MSEQHRHNLKKGISYILVAWVFFTVLSLLVRLNSTSVATPVNLFFMNIIGGLCTLPIFMHGGWHELKTKRPFLILFRALMGLLGFTLLFLCIQRVSLANAMLLGNSAPLILPFVVWGWLKIKIEHRLWFSIILGFIGICFILKPTEAILNLGAIYGVLSACCLAVNMVAVRLLSYTEKHHTVLFYYFFLAGIISLPFAIYYWTPLGFWDFLSLIAIGACAFLGQLCFFKAFHYAKASQVGPFAYIAVVYAFIFDVIFFHYYPDIYSIIGSILVIIGGVLTILLSKPPTPVAPPPQNS